MTPFKRSFPRSKKELRRLLVYFADVSEIGLSQVTWRFRYHRNNQNYRLLLGICYLAAGLLQTQSDGSKRLMNFWTISG